MNCFICNTEMESYFETDFSLEWIDEKYKYVRCPYCGLVVSDTVYNMSEQKWGG